MAYYTVFDIATLNCYMGVLSFPLHIDMIADLYNYMVGIPQHDKYSHIYEIYKVSSCYTVVCMTSGQHYISLFYAPCYSSKLH